jgi:coenzyme Q-binding protein COQ10
MPKHAEMRPMPHTPRQLFDLVADVERYPEFLPWCAAARIRRRDSGSIVADLVIGFGLLRERFTSKAALFPAAPGAPRIDIEFVDGPFRRLQGHWVFHPRERGCEVEFYVDFEFRSRLLQATIEMLFHEAVRRMVRAFEERAHKVYGC